MQAKQSKTQPMAPSTTPDTIQEMKTRASKRTPGRKAAGWFAGAALAGLFCLVAPQQARAQVTFGVQVGSYPAYAAPAYAYGNGYGYAAPYAYPDWQQQQYLQQQQWRAEHWQHERWEHEHAWGGDRDDYRGHDGHWDHRDGR